MKQCVFFVLFSMFCWFAVPVIAHAADMSLTGFYYPLKNDDPSYANCGKWLSRPSPNGCYNFTDADGNPVYHTGVDMISGQNSSVSAIADGHVIDVSESGWSSGSTTNVAILIEHKLANGTTFTALYGHIISSGA